ncbi:unnamed protein product [Urochloa decumbens]|uniref:MYB transcription factor n=1 Tax=Urochloa decumbens TaxID=240449 RepID=A0ABC9AGL2_9POAL
MGAPKQRWTSEEDAALRTGVARHGVGNWRTILNDPQLSSILRYRSNVDLKDKWRNMNITVTPLGSRDKVRTAAKKARAATKNDDHSTSIITITSDADDEIIDAKPIVSVSSEAWNTSISKESHSRLDKIILEAIKNLNEPTGSHKITIANYIEVRRKYRIAPSSPRLEGRSPKMLLLEDVQKDPLKVGNGASKSLTRSQVDAELARMATMTPEAAAAAAASAVEEAEAIIAEAEAAAREAEAAEAEAQAAQAFAEAAFLTLKNRNAVKLMAQG